MDYNQAVKFLKGQEELKGFNLYNVEAGKDLACIAIKDDNVYYCTWNEIDGIEFEEVYQ